MICCILIWCDNLQPPQVEPLVYGATWTSDHQNYCGLSVTEAARGRKLWPASPYKIDQALKVIAAYIVMIEIVSTDTQIDPKLTLLLVR